LSISGSKFFICKGQDLGSAPSCLLIHSQKHSQIPIFFFCRWFKSNRCHFYLVFTLDVAITDKPTINTTIAGAGLSVGSPEKNIHIDKAIQMIPITSLNLNTFQPRHFLLFVFNKINAEAMFPMFQGM
jgi:hypothetical protein